MKQSRRLSSIIKRFMIILLILSPFLPQAQGNFYIFDMSEFLSEMEKDWSIGNGIDVNTGEFVGPYFEVIVQNGMNMNGYRLEIMNSTITVYGDSINSGVVEKRFESSNLYFAPPLNVSEVDRRQSIKMYPNPSNEFVHFEGQYMNRIIIYDINGKLVTRSRPRSDSFTLHLGTNIASGTYIVQIYCDNKKGIFKRLIIK